LHPNALLRRIIRLLDMSHTSGAKLLGAVERSALAYHSILEAAFAAQPVECVDSHIEDAGRFCAVHQYRVHLTISVLR